MEKFQASSNEKAAVILEIGSLFSKMGFSGDGIPKKIKYTPQIVRNAILQKGESKRVNRHA
jgi:hypothetical protein